MYDLKVGQLIECIWFDPAVGATWMDSTDVKFWKYTCQSIGYVHKVEPEGLILTACYGNDPDGDRSLLLRQYLPWGSITDLWVLE